MEGGGLLISREAINRGTAIIRGNTAPVPIGIGKVHCTCLFSSGRKSRIYKMLLLLNLLNHLKNLFRRKISRMRAL